jgi:ADP-heptose:LPS heptosyltransferase
LIKDPGKIVEAYEEGRIRKILLIRISRMGDLLFTTPAVRCLKARFPRADFHYLTNPYSAGALEGNPHIARIHLMDRKSLLWRYLRLTPAIGELKRIPIDLAIPLRWRNEYRTIFRRIRVPYLFRLAGSEEAHPVTHTADSYLKVLAALGVKPDHRGMELFHGPEDEAAVEAFLVSAGMREPPLVVFHPGSHQTMLSGHMNEAAKRAWPVRQWAGLVREVAARLGVKPVLTGVSGGDLAFNREIIRLSGVECPLFVEKGVARLGVLLMKADGFVCSDTGPLHVGSIAGAPTVALFGPSRPAVTGPYRNRGGSTVLQKKLPCSPCKGSKIRCTDNVCMQLITPREACEALLDLMNAPGAGPDDGAVSEKAGWRGKS